MSARALGLLLLVASGTALPGCAGEPDPASDPLERARVLDARLKAAEEARREREREAAEEEARRRRGAEGGVGGAAGSSSGALPEPGLSMRARAATSSGPWKRALLARHGALLTPLQRSALQAASLESYEQGEEMCRRWLEENRRFADGGAEAGEAGALSDAARRRDTTRR